MSETKSVQPPSRTRGRNIDTTSAESQAVAKTLRETAQRYQFAIKELSRLPVITPPDETTPDALVSKTK